jgi:hypothetical protein
MIRLNQESSSGIFMLMPIPFLIIMEDYDLIGVMLPTDIFWTQCGASSGKLF